MAAVAADAADNGLLGSFLALDADQGMFVEDRRATTFQRRKLRQAAPDQ